MRGFFGKQQYAAGAPGRLTMKLSKHLCRECSTCAMFLNSPLTVSMIALFLVSILSETEKQGLHHFTPPINHRVTSRLYSIVNRMNCG